MNKEKDVWIFDVCGTLYTVNTTFAFLEFFFQKHDESRLHQLLVRSREKTSTTSGEPYYFVFLILTYSRSLRFLY